MEAQEAADAQLVDADSAALLTPSEKSILDPLLELHAEHRGEMLTAIHSQSFRPQDVRWRTVADLDAFLAGYYTEVRSSAALRSVCASFGKRTVLLLRMSQSRHHVQNHTLLSSVVLAEVAPGRDLHTHTVQEEDICSRARGPARCSPEDAAAKWGA